jgi:hypothetical protein
VVIRTGADWLKLPLKLRQRWWRETDYGKREPSDDLKNEIEKILSAVGAIHEADQAPKRTGV